MDRQHLFSILDDETEKIGIALSDQMKCQLETYLRELMRWNEKINLTGHKDEKSVVADFFVDSLAFHKAGENMLRGSIMDIGTGAGFPGLPLKISEPDIFLTLIEPNLKKVSFLHHIIGTLKLDDVRVMPKRIEDLSAASEYEKAFDFVILKALRFDVCLPYVKPLLKQAGKLILSRSSKNSTTPVISGFSIHNTIDYKLPFGFGGRTLYVLQASSA